jgi:release factor glutamine methyltransferase
MLGRAGVESPVLEAQLLVAHALGTDRLGVISQPDRALSREEIVGVSRLVARREAREPLAYILGKREFYGLELECGSGVLVPRPETELLVDFALETLPQWERPTVLDIGTGSGCIAISVLARAPWVRAIAIDISTEALSTTERNAERHGVPDRFQMLQGDIRRIEIPGQVEMILSNPPYIPSSEIESLQPEVRDCEPREAFDGGAGGLEYYRAIAQRSQDLLAAGGTIAVEVGAGQARDVADIFETHGLGSIRALKDLQGIERVVSARKS